MSTGRKNGSVRRTHNSVSRGIDLGRPTRRSFPCFGHLQGLQAGERSEHLCRQGGQLGGGHDPESVQRYPTCSKRPIAEEIGGSGARENIFVCLLQGEYSLYSRLSPRFMKTLPTCSTTRTDREARAGTMGGVQIMSCTAVWRVFKQWMQKQTAKCATRALRAVSRRNLL